jgi:hypothetical protein
MYNRIACLDSTHHTCFFASGKDQHAFLYSVVVKNLTTGAGAPAAFMITASEAQYVGFSLILGFYSFFRSQVCYRRLPWLASLVPQVPVHNMDD